MGIRTDNGVDTMSLRDELEKVLENGLDYDSDSIYEEPDLMKDLKHSEKLIKKRQIEIQKQYDKEMKIINEHLENIRKREEREALKRKWLYEEMLLMEFLWWLKHEYKIETPDDNKYVLKFLYDRLFERNVSSKIWATQTREFSRAEDRHAMFYDILDAKLEDYK